MSIRHQTERNHGENDEDCGTGLTQTNKQNACQCHEALQEIHAAGGKATSDYKREEYLAAALSALVVTGVVASKLMANLEGKKAAAPGLARKKKDEGKIISTSEDVDELRASTAISTLFSALSRLLHIRRAQYAVARTPSN